MITEFRRTIFLFIFKSISVFLKRLLAISLISIHLFTLTGYHIVFDRLETGSHRRMVDRLDDADYRTDELIEFRIPVALPYQSNWSAFERVDGDIEIGGLHYNYVSRKMVNDTLILLVIPNYDKTRIRHARETFFALVHDMQDQASAGQSVPLPATPKKPFTCEAADVPNIPCWQDPEDPLRSWFINHRIGYSSPPLFVTELPPDQMS